MREAGAEADPFETLVETVTARGARRLDVPLPLPERVQAELVGDLGGVHRVRQVLLVGKHEQDGVAQLVLVQHALEFLARLVDTVAVVRVDDKDDALRVLEVCALCVSFVSVNLDAVRIKVAGHTMPPEGTDLVLTTDVPHRERDVFVFDRLDVEACRRTR